MKSIKLVLVIVLFSLSACAAPATPAPSPTPLPPTAAPTPLPTEVPAMILNYQDNAQVELVTPEGRHIYIDVFNPAVLIKEPSAEDILLTTHLHNDHYYPSFQESFPGKQLFTAEGKIELPDVTVTGIAAAHNSGDAIQAEKATDYIYILEMAGMRIAHFGDIGQDALTDSQLAALGKLDLAIIQLSNSYSSMSADNMKGFNLIDQFKPRLLIPTHSDKATIEIAAGKWKGYFSESRALTLSAASIPAETSLLVLGNLSIAYGTLFKLDAWK